MTIHLSVVVIVVMFGIWLKISLMEWLLCFILFGLVWLLNLLIHH